MTCMCLLVCVIGFVYNVVNTHVTKIYENDMQNSVTNIVNCSRLHGLYIRILLI